MLGARCVDPLVGRNLCRSRFAPDLDRAGPVTVSPQRSGLSRRGSHAPDARHRMGAAYPVSTNGRRLARVLARPNRRHITVLPFLTGALVSTPLAFWVWRRGSVTTGGAVVGVILAG